VSAPRLLLFGNVSQPPYCNNLFPPLRAFQKLLQTTLVEPQSVPGFVSTGGARPARVPQKAVIENTDPQPDIVVCLGGALHFSEKARRVFTAETCLAGFALSDPYGLAASLAIAPGFDLFYTQDPQTLPDYAALGIAARRCDPATDPELYRPMHVEPDCDVLYYGKWTPHRDGLVKTLQTRFRVRVHAYSGEKRWSVPVLPPLDTPELLCAAINRSRLALETSLLDDAEGRYHGTFHVTPRPFFAASCGVPSLIQAFPGLDAYFEPTVEIAAFASNEDLLEKAGQILSDEPRRASMGRRARQRVLRDHTWDRRVEAFLLDARAWKARPGPRPAR
jgi:spore maturation protein CgeB